MNNVKMLVKMSAMNLDVENVYKLVERERALNWRYFL